MEDKRVYLFLEYLEQNKPKTRGCLTCGAHCNIEQEEIEAYFDVKDCKQWRPKTEYYNIKIYNKEEKEKILQFIKDNHYGEV